MRKRRFIDPAALCFFEILVCILRMMPLAVVRIVGSGLGRALYYIGPARRKVAMANLDTVYGDRLSVGEKRAIARRAAAHFVRCATVLINSYHLKVNKLERIIDARAVGKLEDLVADGHGVIIVSGHLSNFPLVVAYLARRGIPMAVFMRRGGFHPTEQMMEKMQAAIGVRTISRTRAGLESRRWLDNGGVLWLTIDQNARHGVLVPFFGKPATTFPLAVRLARSVGAPILPVFVHENNERKYVIEIEEPVRLPRGKPTETELVADLRRLTGLLEEHVLRSPEQWLWAHRRWRTADKMRRGKSSA